MQESYKKTIFGLKIKQLRNDRELSLFKLSKLSGLSKSYLNEIEKGKKYPKGDKIEILAKVFEVDVEDLVSLKLDKKLAPVGEMLESNLFQYFPFELFGIEPRDLIDIISEAPSKVNAFISAIIEIGKHYNLTRESFYSSALRAYQEAHDNYFEDLELKVQLFKKSYQVDDEISDWLSFFEEILREEYGYTIQEIDIEGKDKELADLKVLFVRETKTLVLSNRLPKTQKIFVLAKEVGYNFLELKERMMAFPLRDYTSFEELLHNFYASYFAAALLVPEKELVEDLKLFFSNKKWNQRQFEKMIYKYNNSPELVFRRMTNLLPKYFNIRDLFFIRMIQKEGVAFYDLDKELHLVQSYSPRANKTLEHYCRRWAAIKTLNDLEQMQEKEVILNTQLSTYPEYNESKYWIISMADVDPYKQGFLRSVSLGVSLNKANLRKIPFLLDAEIPENKVGVTCESCGIEDCESRVAKPVRFNMSQKLKRTEVALEKLKKQFLD